MSEQTRVRHPKEPLLSTDVEGFDSLAELALNMRSSWNHATDEVWRQLDPVLWDLTHNPWVVLQTVSRAKLQDVLTEPAFRKVVDDLVQGRRDAAEAPAWFQQTYPQSPLSCVAYFSMEFMLGEALPIYSGGLGNVAGDQLKAASDLGVPVIGVGLLYQQGYFRQVIDQNGAQEAIYPYNDPGQLPIIPLRHPNGEWLRLQLDLPGQPIWLRAWQVQVGRLRLYLLDSNDAANFPPYRGFTSELYGGGPYLRLMQELILGIGGWRLLAALGIEPEVCHLNEGHAAFAVLERARSFMHATGQSFEVALAVTRAGNLFTTHTAVAAGFDRFAPALIEQCLGGYARTQLGISLDDLLALGRRNPNDPAEDFNMAYLAIRGSGAVNGVSRLHGEVSRHLFQPLFPRWPADEVPVGHVTNGVHMPTWDSAAADKLWTEACGKDRWLGTTEGLEQDIRRVSDTSLWQFRTAARTAFVQYVRGRLSTQLAASGASPEAVDGAKHLFDPNTLTLGFARRFATYKRPNLLLHDPERLLRMLTNPQRPMQLIMAGKAHPADQAGQALIQEWTHFIRRPEVRPHVIFLSDYDMLADRATGAGGGCLAQHAATTLGSVWHQRHEGARQWRHQSVGIGRLVGRSLHAGSGVGVGGWPGTWRRSGLGRGRSRGALRPARARGDPRVLYPRRAGYPQRLGGADAGKHGALDTALFQQPRGARIHRATLPPGWPQPTASGLTIKARSACDIVNWRHALDQKWAALRFGEVTLETRGGQHVFEVQVCLNDLDPKAVRVELYADGVMGGAPCGSR